MITDDPTDLRVILRAMVTALQQSPTKSNYRADAIHSLEDAYRWLGHELRATGLTPNEWAPRGTKPCWDRFGLPASHP